MENENIGSSSNHSYGDSDKQLQSSQSLKRRHFQVLTFYNMYVQ